MTNWMEGIFRARGKKEDIEKFIKTELVGDFGQANLILDSEDAIVYRFDGEQPHVIFRSLEKFHISQLDGKKIFVHINDNKEFQFVVPFKTAWDVDEREIMYMARLYNIDIRVNGYECANEIEQDFEVNRKGEIVKLAVNSYIDYEWECAMPLLGG